MGDSEEWASVLSETGTLTPEVVELLLGTHGARAKRAIEGVGEDRVKKYRDFTVVVGHLDEYIVEGETCTCEDQRYNLDPENPDAKCWHQLAVEIATLLDRVEHHDLWYSDVADIM